MFTQMKLQAKITNFSVCVLFQRTCLILKANESMAPDLFSPIHFQSQALL